MKKLLPLLLITILGLTQACQQNSNTDNADNTHDHSQHQALSDNQESTAKKPLSPRTTAMANIGDTHVHIDYSSPGVRGRTIWGGLVAFDQVWVTGAHKATSINFNKDVKINGQTIKAGTYGFFTIPGKEKWTIILNENHEQHLADDYDESLDVIRVEVTPEDLAEKVESLTYQVVSAGEKKGQIDVMWDQLKISLPIENI